MTEADLESVTLLAGQLVQDHHHLDPARFPKVPDMRANYLEYFRSILSSEEVCLATAIQSGVVSGYLYASLSPIDWSRLLKPHGIIHDVCVSPDCRRVGIGTQLVSYAVTWFESKETSLIIVNSAYSNARAQAFFKERGWRPTMVELTRNTNIAEVTSSPP